MRSTSTNQTTYGKTKNVFGSEAVKTKGDFGLTVGPKREKLKRLLVTKYMKKFGLTEDSRILNEEVGKFLNKDKVNDADLKILEKHLSNMFRREMTHGTENNQSQPNLTNLNPLNELYGNSATIDVNRDVKLPPIEKTESRFHQTTGEDLTEEELYMLERDLKRSKEVPLHGDEWAKIMKYNKKVFDHDKKMKVQKAHEVKQKTKDLLDNQVVEKICKQQAERQEKQDYFNYLMKDIDYQKKTEKEKNDEMKRKIMNEKDIRDKQLREDKIRKRIETANELEFDKLLLKKQMDIIENEKKVAHEKKMKEKEAYHQILLANEEFKRQQLEKRRQERESDIKAIEEYSRILDKQEKARADYFKNCQSKQSDFMTRMVENVVNVNNEKLAREDQNILRCHNERERQEKLEEERRKKRLKDQNLETKKYLDYQVQVKKQENEKDREVGVHIASVLKEDTRNFQDEEKEKARKEKENKRLHEQFLKQQIEDKRRRKFEVMNDQEYLYNRRLIEAIEESKYLDE